MWKDTQDRYNRLKNVKEFFINPDVTSLRACCCMYFEQKLATLDVQMVAIRRARTQCREAVDDLRGK